MSTRPLPESLRNVVLGPTPPLPTFGLCGVRRDHNPHEVTEGSLAPFFCTADQSEREPGRSERRLRGSHCGDMDLHRPHEGCFGGSAIVVAVHERLLPPMGMLLKGCEADWVDDVRAGRLHEHRRRV